MMGERSREMVMRTIGSRQRMPRVLWRGGWLVLLALSFAGMVRAAEVSPADAKAARAVIEGQLAALAADDAKRAFAYAAPALREHFGTPENFIEMVRTSYPVVYRPASVAFLKPQWLDGELVQGVHMSDDHGVLWLALYRLQRQKNKSWRISACQLVQAEGRVT
jgi:hypothetical protein